MEVEKSCAEKYEFCDNNSDKLMRGGFSLTHIIKSVQSGETFDRYNHLSVPIPLVLGGEPDYEDNDYDVKECDDDEDYPVINKEIYDTFLFNKFPLGVSKNQTRKNLKLSLRKTSKQSSV